ncbi:MAG: substrate-binding domain-containing protein [Clostridia bacterium]|nr:substrate-binding domain-containing protein [Clostridia bacterium]
MKKKLISIVCAIMALTMGIVGLTACNGAKFDDSKNISVVAREDGSGTKSAFMEIIGLKGKSDVSGVIIGTGTAGILAEVKSNPLAIAYESLGYVTSDVKMLTVDGVAATIENIKNGSYQIARPLNIVYKAATIQSDLNGAFYEFLNSSNAQTIISDNGYVSTKDEATAYTVKSGISGEISVSGSTSLQPLMVILAAEFERIQANVTVTVAGGGSGTGYKNANDGVSDFGMISETFNSTKAENCTSCEVAKDGIAIIVNKANIYDNISLADLKNIYNCEESSNTKITTWADLSK